MSFPSSLSQLILNSQDPNENPFSTAIKFLNKQTIVEPDNGVTLTLLLTIAAYCAIIVVCISIICLPNFQGDDGHARRHWVFKRYYSDGYKQPYWVPNSGLVVAVCHLIGSTVFLVFLGLRYHALKSAFRGTTLHESAWLELRWFPAYCSFFTQAWSTWFFRVSNAPSKASKRLVTDPIIFNTNLIALPASVFILALVMISEQATAVNAQNRILKKLVESLTTAASEWDGGERSISNPYFQVATSDYSSFVNKMAAAISSIRTIGLFWTLMGIPTIIMYVFGVSTLLAAIRKGFRAVDSELECQAPCSNSRSVVEPTFKPKKKARKLQNSYIYLGLHYFSMSVVLFYHIMLGLVYYLVNNQTFTTKHFQVVFMVLSNSGSFLLLIALLVQLVRIILEGQEHNTRAAKNNEKKIEYEEHDDESQTYNAGISLMT